MKKLAAFLVAFLLLVSSAAALNIPYFTGRVTDNAQILSTETQAALTERLKAHELHTGNQIAILTVPSLEGTSIEDYAVKVFEVWKLGQKDKDNGILILVAPNERRMRIEVGYGLEGTLTDLMAGRIIQQVMTPRFKEGNYDSGVTDGTLAVITVLEENTLPAAAESEGLLKRAHIPHIGRPGMSITERILIGTFVFSIIGMFTFIGIVTPGTGWFLYLFLIPFWAIFPIIIFGNTGALICLMTYLILFPVTKLFFRNAAWYKKARTDLKTKGRASIGGFTLRAGGSGGGSSGGSGGGSAGGGGSSGGGGASGGW